MLTVTCNECGEKVEGLLDYENHARAHEARKPIQSPFTRRALAGELPAKASYGVIDARDGGRLDR